MAWLNVARDGLTALDTILSTLDKFARLSPELAFSGHGPAIEQPIEAIDRARRRYERWREEPQKAGWHALKRAVAYALIWQGGIAVDKFEPFLRSSPWFDGNARNLFDAEPEELVQPLLEELKRVGGVTQHEGTLVAAVPHNAPPADWDSARMRVRYWPKYVPKPNE